MKKSKAPEITYIISAYNRPHFLRACIATLQTQIIKPDIIVCLNAHDKTQIRDHLRVCKDMGVKVLMTGKMGATCGYSSADIAAKEATGKWLCFPSDDSLYVPCFADLMLRAAEERNLDLVYCDCVYDPMQQIGGFGRYGLLQAHPFIRGIDKTNFIVKRKWFKGFPAKRTEGDSGADFMLMEDLIFRGARHGKAEGILAVHS